MHAAWYNQHIDQAPLVTGTGAHYIGGRSPVQILNNVREAFYIVRTRRQPVVLGVPLDLQQQTIEPADYTPSADFIPDTGPMAAHPRYVETATNLIKAARRIVIVGGRGVMRSGARDACEDLAERTGALLASTLPVRGLFDHHERSIGVAGGFSHQVARERFQQADLVIAVGASLTHHTVDGGALFPNASVLQIDPEPQGLRQGRRGADVHLRADAREGVEAVLRALGSEANLSSDWPVEDLPALMAGPSDLAKFPGEPGVHDPRAVMTALDAVIPKDWEIVNSSGHCSYFSAQMRGRSADHFLAIREFGAIGNGLSYAAGLAAARPGRPLVLIDGDGGLLMHVQELETIRRHGLKMLICVLNDGAFGSEIHKLRADGLSDHGATFGRGNLAHMAEGFGLRGQTIDDSFSQVKSACSTPVSRDKSASRSFPWITGSRSGRSGMGHLPLPQRGFVAGFADHQIAAEADEADEGREQKRRGHAEVRVREGSDERSDPPQRTNDDLGSPAQDDTIRNLRYA